MKTTTSLGLALVAGLAVAAGAALSQPAPARERACGGVAAQRCPPREYCYIAPPQHPDKAGVCRPRPEVCTQDFNPVCGVNHKTFGNACMAAAAGINVAHVGKCEIEAPSPHA
jgi:hypothetical protein